MFNNYEPPSAVPATNLCGTPLYSYITKKKIKHTKPDKKIIKKKKKKLMVKLNDRS